jgi:hypothetical protein
MHKLKCISLAAEQATSFVGGGTHCWLTNERAINLVCALDIKCARGDSFSSAAASAAGSCSRASECAHTQWIISSCSDKRPMQRRALWFNEGELHLTQNMGGRLFLSQSATSSVYLHESSHTLPLVSRWTQFLTDAFHAHSRFQTFEVWHKKLFLWYQVTFSL